MPQQCDCTSQSAMNCYSPSEDFFNNDFRMPIIGVGGVDIIVERERYELSVGGRV